MSNDKIERDYAAHIMAMLHPILDAMMATLGVRHDDDRKASVSGPRHRKQQGGPMSDEKIERVINAIRVELERAMRDHPKWPTDPVRAAANVAEEAGELVKAVNDYESRKTDIITDWDEAIQTAVTAIRFCVARDSLAYEYVRSGGEE